MNEVIPLRRSVTTRRARPARRRHVVAAAVYIAAAANAALALDPRRQPAAEDHRRPPHIGRITGRELATADAFATAAFAMGLAGPAWTARMRGYEALMLLADGRSLRTPGFPAP